MSAVFDDPLTVAAPDLDVDTLRSTLAASWGLEGELTGVHGERDRNYRVDTTAARYLLKVHNPADREQVLDLQGSVLRHLGEVAPELPVPRVVPTRDGLPWLEIAGRDGRTSLAWVMTWLEGHHPDPGAMSEAEFRDWGRTSAALGRALRGFVHPACSYPIAWDVRRLPQLRPWLEAVPSDQRPLLRQVLDRFDDRVTPRLRTLRAQVVHNDLAPGNVLVDDAARICGITDFGDLTHTALVCDLAIAAADLMSSADGALDLVPALLAGYHEVTPLEDGEVALVADLMAGRLAAAVLITAWRTREQGWAPEIGDPAHRQLAGLVDTGLDALTSRWSAVLDRPARPAYRSAGRTTADLLRARSRTLGPQELSYTHPLHLVGGQGVWLEAADGRRYLDAYNNVPVLGHSHPAVTEAVARQLSTLNTNSRYLQDAPVELAERLLATLPERFDRVLLVNSGSEANDLALRIAEHTTGSTGGIATRFAYHGVTRATADFSPEGWGDRPVPATMRLVEPPTGDVGEVDEVDEVAAAVESLRASGTGVGAIVVDGVFTSDGVHGPAHAWTRAAAAAVRAAGGLYVADEVQAGHGRTGDGLWSFVAGDVPADLVTFGKPMGNGYPVAAIAGPAHLVDPFVEESDYFSTFGGGTAACAAALAVLRVLDEERVVDHVAAVGARLRVRLTEVAAEAPSLAGVRGWGLAIGVDVVDPATGRPDAAGTTRIIEGVRERGVLIGRTGRDRATLKIRPPLVFADEHVDLLTEVLADVTAG